MLDLWPIFAPIAALAVNVVAQVLLVRLQRGRHFLRAVALAFLVGLCALCALHAIWGERSWPAQWPLLLVNVPLYAALSYCYFNFVNLGQSSIRIRLYAEIAEHPGGISVEEMSRRYDEASLMQMRLRRLVESGDIVLREGRYALGRRRFVPVARVIFGLKQFILGRTSEFESGRK